MFTIVKCSSHQSNKGNNKIVPDFNADSAYHFIETQVNFGPRVPNTLAHDKCSGYLIQKLKSYNADVIVQTAKIKAFNDTVLKIKNIIGQFNLKSKERIMLCAHWDTRPWADQDSTDKNKPIPGANDGASGVGVLLEIGRLIAAKSPEIGIDIIFFDAEDYGERPGFIVKNEDNWCLGSQYWSKHKHKADYDPKYAILLDMVGGKDAVFTQEDNSRYFAAVQVNNVWKIANDLGFSKYFSNEKSLGIINDHYFISQIGNISSLIIVQYENGRYFKYWHTHKDNMDVIDRKVLYAVGKTVIHVLFSE